MQFRQLAHFRGGSDGLADLERDQFADDVIPEKQRERKSGDGREDGAKGDVVEDVEAFESAGEEMEVIHHGGDAGLRLAFRKILKDALGPRGAAAFDQDQIAGRCVSSSKSAASSAEATPMLFFRPAACAASRDFAAAVTERNQAIDA